MFLTYLAYLFLSLAMTIISAIIALSAGVFILFRLNKKYGENGLPQLIAKEQLPKYIVTTRVKNIL